MSQVRSVLKARIKPTLNASALAFVPREQPTTVELEVAVTNRATQVASPTFSRNPLDWQEFWDSFHAPVH